MHSIFPIATWFPQYYLSAITKRNTNDGDYSKTQHKWYLTLKDDVIAGISTGFLAVPQGMAYASLAGLHPVYGLYSGIINPVLYMLLGSSLQLSVGPTSILSLLLRTELTNTTDVADFYNRVFVLTFLSGIFNIFLSLIRFGFVSNFLSHPVITGFSAGAAMIICSTQLSNLLGLPVTTTGAEFIETMKVIIHNIQHTHLWTVLIGACSILIIVLMRLHKKVAIIPSSVVVIAIGLILSYTLHFDKHGIKIVGDIPSGLPPIKFAHLLHIRSFDQFLELMPKAILLSLIGFVEAYSIAKTYSIRLKTPLHANNELFAIGFANVIGSFYSCFVTTGSFSRTAVSARANVKTPLANGVSAILVLMTLLFATPLFYHLPKVILAAITITALIALFDVKEMVFLFRTNKTDFMLCMLAFILTLLIGVELGVVVTIGLSLFLVLYKIAKPEITIKGLNSFDSNADAVYSSDFEHSDGPRDSQIATHNDVALLRFEQSIIFINVEAFQNAVFRAVSTISANRPNSSVYSSIIVDMESCREVDATAVHIMMELYGDLLKSKIHLLFWRSRPAILQAMDKAQAWKVINRSHFVDGDLDDVLAGISHASIESGTTKRTDGLETEVFIHESAENNEKLPLLQR